MSSWTLAEISAADDAATIAEAVATVERVSVAHELSVRGYDDLADTSEEMTAWLHNQTYSRRTLVLALPSPDALLSEAVGHLQVLLPQQDNTHVAHVAPTVDPAHTGRGVGTALLAEAERRARANSRTSLIAWTMQAGEPEPGEPVLTPPTGVGVLNPQDPSVRFALAQGFTAEQGERHSLLRLPVAPALVASLHDAAEAEAGAPYRVHTWEGLPPAAVHAELAALYTRMSTDAPHAGLDLTEQRWDADRVRHSFKQAAAAGYDMVTVAAEHAATGQLAGFTQVELFRRDPALGFQGDTLVRREHRGHRLGLLIKTAMLHHLALRRPELRRILAAPAGTLTGAWQDRGMEPSAPVVLGVAASATHSFSKAPAAGVELVAGHGVVGDAHAGPTVRHRSRVKRDPTQPNLRQVHLIHREFLDLAREHGYDVAPGGLGENVLTGGVDLLALPRDTRLRLGSQAVVRITGLRNPCQQINDFRAGLLKLAIGRDGAGEIVRRTGVMSVVEVSGVVRPGDPIEVVLPVAPHLPLEPV